MIKTKLFLKRLVMKHTFFSELAYFILVLLELDLVYKHVISFLLNVTDGELSKLT